MIMKYEISEKSTFRDVFKAFKGDPELEKWGKLGGVAQNLDTWNVDMCHFCQIDWLKFIVLMLFSVKK